MTSVDQGADCVLSACTGPEALQALSKNPHRITLTNRIENKLQCAILFTYFPLRIDEMKQSKQAEDAHDNC